MDRKRPVTSLVLNCLAVAVPSLSHLTSAFTGQSVEVGHCVICRGIILALFVFLQFTIKELSTEVKTI